MTPIDRPPDLQRYYQDSGVAADYMHRRTAQPLNGVLHRRQVQFLNRALAAPSLHRVLEIACGPARLTAAVRGVRFGVAVDSSPAMLQTAQQRMNGARDSWSFLRTDAFALPFRTEAFDAAYTLRFVRHFQLEDRARLYREIRRVLRPGGVFIVDAINRVVSYPYRVQRGLERFHIYDVLYERGELETELREAGFRIVEMAGVIKHFAVQRPLNRLRLMRLGGLASLLIRLLDLLPSQQPSTWMLVCEKR